MGKLKQIERTLNEKLKRIEKLSPCHKAPYKGILSGRVTNNNPVEALIFYEIQCSSCGKKHGIQTVGSIKVD